MSATIKNAVVTEKAASALSLNKYVFFVDLDINKIQLAKFVEKKYSVKVAKVNMAIVKGKTVRRGKHAAVRSNRKKAVLTLAAGFEIAEFKELF